MDILEFLLIITVFAVVLIWYLKNAEAKSDGLLGLLALKADPEIADKRRRKSSRVKSRPIHKAKRHADGLHDSRADAAPHGFWRDEQLFKIRRTARHNNLHNADDAAVQLSDLNVGRIKIVRR